MTLKDEITEIFNEAQRTADAAIQEVRLTAEGQPSKATQVIQINFDAVQKAIYTLAERIDGLESGRHGLR